MTTDQTDSNPNPILAASLRFKAEIKNITLNSEEILTKKKIRFTHPQSHHLKQQYVHSQENRINQYTPCIISLAFLFLKINEISILLRRAARLKA